MKQIQWRVRLACAERGIWSATELQRIVFQRTGVRLNVQTLQAWFRNRPIRIEVRTLMAILNALGCPITDLIGFDPPRTKEESRATPQETIHFRQKGHMPSRKQGRAKLARGKTGPQPDVGKMLKALAETTDPVAAEQLRQSSAASSTLRKLKRKDSRKS